MTGISALPSHIALDTAGGSRVRVPLSWRKADFPATNTALLSLEVLPWQRRGDYLVFDRYSNVHVVGADSIVLGFDGWAGRAVAYLERADTGYRGFLFFSPLSRPEELPGIQIFLAPSGCPHDLD